MFSLRFFLFCLTILVGVLAIVGFKHLSKPTPYQFPELLHFPQMPMVENNPVTIEGVELGRYLFYDTILSLDRSTSCASCHKQQFAFSDAPLAFSTGINGDTLRRNTMPLFNLAWYPLMFWDGKATSIEEQVFHPVRRHDEMNLNWNVAVERVSNSVFYRYKFESVFGSTTIDSVLIAKAIAQFERTLISNNSKYDSVIRGEAYFTEEEFKGFNLMNDQTKGNCLHCHTTDADALGTTLQFSNNGLDSSSAYSSYIDKGRGEVTGDSTDIGKFKTPSLRNVALTAPYMHDGRFSTLDEVLDFYSEGVQAGINTDSKMSGAHNGGIRLSDNEKECILAFLNTLTDYSFIENPAFSNPFIQ